MNTLDINNLLQILYKNEFKNHIKSLQLSQKTQDMINTLRNNINGNYIFYGISTNNQNILLKSQLNFLKEEKKIFIFINKNLVLELESTPGLIEVFQEKPCLPIFIKKNNKLFLISEFITDESLKEKYDISCNININMIKKKYGIFLQENIIPPYCFEENIQDKQKVNNNNSHHISSHTFTKINHENNIPLPIVDLFDKYFSLHLWFMLQKPLSESLLRKLHILKNHSTEKKTHLKDKKNNEKKKYTSRTIAFLMGENIEYLTVWTYKQLKNNNQNNTQHFEEKNSKHFFIESHFSSFGSIQFDITTYTKKLFIIIKSNKPFDQQTKNGIDLLFDQLLSELQWTGKLEYKIFK